MRPTAGALPFQPECQNRIFIGILSVSCQYSYEFEHSFVLFHMKFDLRGTQPTSIAGKSLSFAEMQGMVAGQFAATGDLAAGEHVHLPTSTQFRPSGA